LRSRFARTLAQVIASARDFAFTQSADRHREIDAAPARPPCARSSSRKAATFASIDSPWASETSRTRASRGAFAPAPGLSVTTVTSRWSTNAFASA
jgi:hypothetical protein